MSDRLSLELLAPRWLSSGDGRGQMGFTFECPICVSEHWVECWFALPLDFCQPVTETSGRQLHHRDGDGLHDISIFPPIHHGEELIFIYDGEIIVG